jgi:thiol-disulfide isomerase/thioredoxin
MNAGKVAIVTILAGSLSIGAAIFGQKWLGEGNLPRLSMGRGAADRIDNLPDFRLPDIEGHEVQLSSFSGKVVIINYWASWCPPCVREMPMLIRLQEALDPSQVQVVGIAIDRLEAVEQFIEGHPVNYPVLIGDVEAVELSRRLGNRLQGLPFTVIFDHHGRRAFSQVGEITQATLDTQLQALLPKTRVPDTAANGG